MFLFVFQERKRVCVVGCVGNNALMGHLSPSTETYSARNGLHQIMGETINDLEIETHQLIHNGRDGAGVGSCVYEVM